MDSKYGQRELLCEYNLSTDFFESKNIIVSDLVPLKDSYLLTTNIGALLYKKVLKENEIGVLRDIIENNEFLRENYEVLYEVKNENDDQFYFLKLRSDFQGNMNSIDCSISAVNGLKKFHLKTKPVNINLDNSIFKEKLIKHMKKDLYKIKNYKERVDNIEYKRGFNKVFSENVDDIIYRIKLVIEKLNETHIEIEKALICLCIKDTSCHNVIHYENEGLFIDISDSYLGFRSINLSEFIDQCIRYFDYDIERGKMILEEYIKDIDLTENELILMYLYFIYPEDIIEIITSYYDCMESFNEEIFLGKLSKRLSLKDNKINFSKLIKEFYIDEK